MPQPIPYGMTWAVVWMVVANTYTGGWVGADGPKAHASTEMLWSPSTQMLYSVSSTMSPVHTFSVSSDAGDHWTKLEYGDRTDLVAIDDASSPPTLFAAYNNPGYPQYTNLQAIQNGLATSSIGNPSAALTIDSSITPHRLYTYAQGSVTSAVATGGYFSTVVLGNVGLNNETVTALALDSRSAPSTVYAATTAGLYSAHLGDAAWVAVTPPGVFFNQLFFASDTGTLIGSNGSSVYEYAVGGGAWATLSGGVTDRLVMSANHRLYMAGPSYGVKSIAVGESTWTTLPMGPFAAASARLIVDDTVTPARLFVDGTISGFRARATDAAWTAFAEPLSFILGQNPFPQLALGPERGVYATAFIDGVWHYDGATWSEVGDAHDFVCAGTTNSTIGQLTYAGGTLYASNGSSCVFYFTGGHWVSALENVASPGVHSIDGFAVDTTFTPPVLYGAGSSGTFSLTRGGTVDWAALTSAPTPRAAGPVMVTDGASQPATLYVASASGVSVSIDAGATFTPMASAPANVSHLLIDPSTTPHTVAATVDTFMGTLWSAPNGTFSEIDAHTFQPASFAIDTHTSPATWYLTNDADGSLQVSEDHGLSWAPAGTGYGAYALVVDGAAEPKVIFALSGEMIVRAVTPLRVDLITPSTVAAGTSTDVTIHGDGFFAGVQLLWAGAALPVTFVDAHTIRVTAPAHAAGAVDVTLIEPLLPPFVLPHEFSYLGPPPLLSGVSPAQASTGASLTLTGSGFASDATILVGDAAPVVTMVSATSVTLTAPAHSDGLVDIVLTNPDGQSTRLVGALSYVTTPKSSAATAPPHGTATTSASQTMSQHCNGSGEPWWIVVTAAVYARGRRRRH